MIGLESISINSPSPVNSKKIIGKKSSSKASAKKRYTQVDDSAASTEANSITNPFLFLQEVDEYTEEQGKLKEKGNQILRCLNDIRFAMLSGTLQEQHIIQMQEVIKATSHKFQFQEFQQIIDEILLRSEIELAKLEMNCKK